MGTYDTRGGGAISPNDPDPWVPETLDEAVEEINRLYDENAQLRKQIRDAAPVPAREWIPCDEDERMIEQFCKELNLAHDELLIGQGCANTDTGDFDWPEWTPQASSIRWAERLLGRKLAKTNLWTLFPPPAADK